MRLVGLTGGIASGKSSFSLFLKTLDVPIVDCDAIAHDAVRKGTWGYKRVRHAFQGYMIIREEDGELDREAISEIVFGDPAARRRLNTATHLPVLFGIIRQVIGHWLRFRSTLFIDMPLLFETGFYRVTRPNILIRCSPEVQIDRLKKRDSLSLDAAEARIFAQMPVEEKQKLADIIIDNDGSLQELEQKAKATVERLHHGTRALVHQTLLSPAGVFIAGLLLWKVFH